MLNMKNKMINLHEVQVQDYWKHHTKESSWETCRITLKNFSNPERANCPYLDINKRTKVRIKKKHYLVLQGMTMHHPFTVQVLPLDKNILNDT